MGIYPWRSSSPGCPTLLSLRVSKTVQAVNDATDVAGHIVAWKRVFHRLLSVALMYLVCIAKVQAQGSYQPPQGYVPDARTAIRIAIAVWSPIYGEKHIQSERPFHAALNHGIWTVTGSLRPSPHGYVVVGGVALAKISKKDGCILQVIHGK